MKQFSILTAATAIICLLPGCAGTRDNSNHEHADLIVYGPGHVDIEITKRSWAGFWGPEGYVGYQDEHYAAGLRGSGPAFVNPTFIDNPPSFRCVGTIILDREHNKIVVDMRRIVSKSGEPEKAKPHPANGTYLIKTMREARPGEPSL
jgi:hypothetical protein